MSYSELRYIMEAPDFFFPAPHSQGFALMKRMGCDLPGAPGIETTAPIAVTVRHGAKAPAACPHMTEPN